MVDELKEKEQIIQELEERCQQADSDQTLSKRSAATIRSLETQLKASEQVILKLKKQNKELEESADGNTKRKPTKFNNNNAQQQQYQPPKALPLGFDSSDCDSGPLSESQLDLVENKAEQIFQRSRSTRGNLRRSLIVMPASHREENSTSEEDCSFKKTYSLRQRSERRRSFQPRRYMGGHTPPSKRTFVGDPRQAQISMFSTDTAEEPEFDYDWGRIASLRPGKVLRLFMFCHILCKSVFLVFSCIITVTEYINPKFFYNEV